MKIGRNEKCPCGSGKKYKKCCLGKTESTKQEEEKQPVSKERYDEFIPSQFEDHVHESKKMILLFESYNFYDIVTAIFSINSWRENRAYQYISLSMNDALHKMSKSGKKHITDYKEFKDLYDDIKLILKEEVPEQELDPYIQDFGEIKIQIDGEWFPIIVGSGYEYTYSSALFLKYLNLNDKVKEIRSEALKYLKEMISYLTVYNKKPLEEYKMTFNCPSEDYWNTSKQFVDQILSKNFLSGFEKLFDTDNIKIEMAHFIKYEKKIYPLFNASFVTDLFSIILKEKLSTTKITEDDLSDILIRNLVHDIYNIFDVNEQLLTFCKIDGINDFIATFSYIDEGNLLFCVNESKMNDSKIKLEEIEQKLKAGEFTIYEKAINKKGHNAIKVSEIKNIYFISTITHLDITETYVHFGGEEKEYKNKIIISSSDLILLLAKSKDFSEIIKLIEFINKESIFFNPYVGISGILDIARNFNFLTSPGAVHYSMFNIGLESTYHLIYELFSEKLINYPFFEYEEMFDNPHRWDYQSSSLGWSYIINKSAKELGGYLKLINKTYFFLSHNLSYFDTSPNELDRIAINTVEDIFKHSLIVNKNITLKLENKIIHLIYMPLEYAKKVDQSGFTNENREYVKSDSFIDYQKPNYILIRYTMNNEKIIQDLVGQVNRKISNDILLEILSPLKKHLTRQDYDFIVESIRKTDYESNIVDLEELELPFFIEQPQFYKQLEDSDFSLVRKEISLICKDENIEPGTYTGKDVTEIIRKLQNRLYKKITDLISIYSPESIHYYAIDKLSYNQFLKFENDRRWNYPFDFPDELKIDHLDIVMSKNDEYITTIQDLKNLIELNLTIPRFEELININVSNFNIIEAFIHWIGVLQSASDLEYYEMGFIELEITYDYIINTNSTEIFDLSNLQMKDKIYNYNTYQIKLDDLDKKYLEKVKDALKRDLGFRLEDLYDVVQFLSVNFKNNNYKQISKNIYEINKNDLIEMIFKDCDEQFPKQDIIRTIDYLILDIKKLKQVDGDVSDLLPIWEREKRNNRFDQKPLLIVDDKVQFSPVNCGILNREWGLGLFDFMLPYTIGLENTDKVISEWKSRYEKQIVEDIANIFIELNLSDARLFKEQYLHKLDKKGNHPKELGDYDILFIDNVNKVVWNVEAKFIKKHKSIKEFYRRQYNFFKKSEYDIKFNNRIEYIENNFNKLKSAFGITNQDKYDFKNMFVLNKHFIPVFQNVKGLEYCSIGEFRIKVIDYYKKS